MVHLSFMIIYGTFFAVFWRPLAFLLLRAEVFRMDVAAMNIYRGGFGHPSTSQSRWAQFRVTYRHHTRGKMGKDGAFHAICSEKCVFSGRHHFECQLCELRQHVWLFLISCCDSWRFSSNSRSCLGSSQIYLAPVLQQQLAVRRAPSRVTCHGSWNKGTKVKQYEKIRSKLS